MSAYAKPKLEASPNWTPAPRYKTVHDRLRKIKGPASRYRCEILGCAAHAQEWAYDHTDPDELTFMQRGRPIAFSANLDRYRPWCRSHHRLYDFLIAGRSQMVHEGEPRIEIEVGACLPAAQ